MPQRLALFACILLAAAFAGCCHDRVWRCPDGECGVLSGRNDGCSDCSQCDHCGEAMGSCRCGIFSAWHRLRTCGRGCGEMYWGDWISDPPPPCDPCDECTGEFVGRRCCPPKRTMLFGGRCCDESCATCGPSGEAGSEWLAPELKGSEPTMAAPKNAATTNRIRR